AQFAAHPHAAVGDVDHEKVTVDLLVVDGDLRLEAAELGHEEERARQIARGAEPLEPTRARLDLLDDKAVDACAGPKQPIAPGLGLAAVHVLDAPAHQ